jgi:hypothetical protein
MEHHLEFDLGRIEDFSNNPAVRTSAHIIVNGVSTLGDGVLSSNDVIGTYMSLPLLSPCFLPHQPTLFYGPHMEEHYD